MKNILVISDTHHNYEMMGAVFDYEKDIQVIIHLGDEHDDLDFFPEYTANKDIYQVAGIYHRDYLASHNFRILNFQIDPFKFQISHVEQHLSLNHQTDIFLFGHTHHSLIDIKNNQLFLNPGHLKAPKDRGAFASYCILQIENDSLKVMLKNLKFEIIKESHFKCQTKLL